MAPDRKVRGFCRVFLPLEYLEFMTKESKIYYLYQHLRNDKIGEDAIFYIGIGTKRKPGRPPYDRAFSKLNRNRMWKGVVRKYGYSVEILLESPDKQFIKEEEKRLIKHYGRRDLGTGQLTNMTDGGDGCYGMVMSEEHKRKIREANLGNQYTKGRKFTPEQLEKAREAGLKRRKPPEQKIKRPRKPIPRKPKVPRYKPIVQFTIKGEYIREWGSIKEVYESLGIERASISKCCTRDRNKAGGYVWRFKKDCVEGANIDVRGKRGNSKLTPEEVFELKTLHKEGEKVKSLSDRFKLKESSIYSILNGSNWKDIQV